MRLRTIKQFVLHLQTFRNIQLWYQGIYYLKFAIYCQDNKRKNQKPTYAHPYALTQCNLASKHDSSSPLYDSQIVSHSYINSKQSTYYSKSFHLKYFQQQVQINDLCHFRIQVDTFNQHNVSFVLQVSLCFFDSFKKDVKQTKNFKQESKQVRKVKYVINPFMNSQFLHQYIPIVFEDQYFSLNNMVLHGINVDHRIRMNSLQLSEFACLDQGEKKALIQKMRNSKNQKRNTISQYLKSFFKVQNQHKIIQKMHQLLIQQVKSNKTLLQEYKKIFQFSITQAQQKYFSEQLIYPNQILQFASLQLDQNVRLGSEFQASQKDPNKVQFLQDKLISILNKINYAGAQNLKIWQTLIKLIKVNPRFTVAFYQKIYKQNQKNFWSKLNKIQNIQTNDITSSFNKNTSMFVKQLEKNRNQLVFTGKVYEYKLAQKKASLPTVIIQQYLENNSQDKVMSNKVDYQIKDSSKNQLKFQGIHLIVLVHGFQGSSYDMKIIKNNISYLFPQSMFLCCTANQDLTDTDIFQMGNRLALEIKSYIIQNFPNNTLGRLSFIGHSLGGLKIRAALPKLAQYKEKFHCFISFSSPHLGYKVNTSSVIEAGIWILQKMKQSQCLKQLTMTDNSDPYETTLYRLSLQEGLQHFKKIYFYSSMQDSYAPYESARIQIDPAFMGSNDPLKNIHCQMVKNILRNVKKSALNRANVTFTINNKNLDSLIGRTAHILFLETAQLIKILTFTNQNIFS